MASKTARQWESSPAQIYGHQVLPASPEEIEDGAYQKTGISKDLQGPLKIHACT